MDVNAVAKDADDRRKKAKKKTKRRRAPVSAPPPGDLDDDADQQNGEYVVERVVGKRIAAGKEEYYIKWKGWEDKDNTWEPIEHLENCNEMIEAYEATVRSEILKRKPGRSSSSSLRRKRKGSSKSQTASFSNGFGLQSDLKFKTEDMNGFHINYQSDDEYSSSGVDDDDETQDYTVLFECPPGKNVRKIHAVTVVDGCLSFLVQWENKDENHNLNGLTNGHSTRPSISKENSNIVRANVMNEHFPQKVIEFYQTRVQFNVSLNTEEEEAKNAARALVQAKEREAVAAARTLRGDISDDDDVVDAASAAIEKEERRKDRFNTRVSDLSSSSDSDGLLIHSDDE